MRIVIDMQGAQSTGSRNRGIGRYSHALAEALIRQRRSHEIILVLNGAFANTIARLRAQFSQLLPKANIRVWEGTPGSAEIGPDANPWKRAANELLREAFISSLRPDVVLVTSLFEGLIDDAVTSIGLLDQAVPTAVVLYDLIPLVNRKPYLENPDVEAWYERKLASARRANMLLAISDSSRQEAMRFLCTRPGACVSISTAADPQFKPIEIDEARRNDLLARLGLTRSIVMYTGGIDHRKNIEGLIQAYGLLSPDLRVDHQLAIVCSIQSADRNRLSRVVAASGLNADEVVFTGFVSETDLVALYNLCKLFVFPSWHEGFGLPALEAMSCGRAVVAANTSSLPEVIGRADALFDPYSETDMARSMSQALRDPSWLNELERHGLERAQLFSWNATAEKALAALESMHVEALARKASSDHAAVHPAKRRPRLAVVAPLLPERSGISNYCSELLPELARHYDIEVVSPLAATTDPWLRANGPLRSPDWLVENAIEFDRVLYHFGNSSFHQHMFELLAKVPGVVVLHDFYLSGVAEYMHSVGTRAGDRAVSLHQSHGYLAAMKSFALDRADDVAGAYPCNLDVLQQARGVIVHSQASCSLARLWYGDPAADEWAVIPLLRALPNQKSKAAARRALQLSDTDFVVCSFGLLGRPKLNDVLVKAWRASALAGQPGCQLLFVGENDAGPYGAEIERALRELPGPAYASITGWVDDERYCLYLAAADLAVQLRTRSRGETSAAVLDCLNSGVATIANAHGSLSELPDGVVCMLADEFETPELTRALETLWRDGAARAGLSERGRVEILERHSPRDCANLYAEAIERFHNSQRIDTAQLATAVAQLNGPSPVLGDWLAYASMASWSLAPSPSHAQLLVDVSELVRVDARTGIQRVVRSILKEWLVHPPEGFRVEPVYAADDGGYRYARNFTFGFLGGQGPGVADPVMEARVGDQFILLDLYSRLQPAHLELHQRLQRLGVPVRFVVYDLLPVQMPHHFPDEVASAHHAWLNAVAASDGAICISRAVADELFEWLQLFGPRGEQPFEIDWFHLGADLEASKPSVGLPARAKETIEALARGTALLVVGIVEPRKRHDQVLDAFEQLWKQGSELQLVIVGKPGWNTEELALRLRTHPQVERRLFWFEHASDELLEKVYGACKGLISASDGEGFGLNLIEAARAGLPILARDIPVFREVAGQSATYFSALDARALAFTLEEWARSLLSGGARSSKGLAYLTWAQSAANLFTCLHADEHYRLWRFDGAQRFLGSDRRLQSHVGVRRGQCLETSKTAGHLLFGPYLQLPRGCYRVALSGHGKFQGLEGAHADITIASGTEVLAFYDATTWRLKNGEIFLGEFELPHDCTDLEVRLWVPATARLTIQKLELSLATKGSVADAVSLGMQSMKALGQPGSVAGSPCGSSNQLLVDISVLVLTEARRGVQRVVRSLLWHWLTIGVAGYRVEPVYATGDGRGYFYAKSFCRRFLGASDLGSVDEPIVFRQGDLFIALDLAHHVFVTEQESLRAMRQQGVRAFALVYDLLPIKMPHAFLPNIEVLHANWLDAVSRLDGAVCISRSVADDLFNWCESSAAAREGSLEIHWFHLGSDLEASVPSTGDIESAETVLQSAKSMAMFLMVGTLEPRKQHQQALLAFEQLWRTGLSVALVIVGSEGWRTEAVMKSINSHPERDSRLFWLKDASDDVLAQLYLSCACLLAASSDEGFGLPIIEAARASLPVLARDIPVFREVGGDAISYFEGEEPIALANAIIGWLDLKARGEIPVSSGMSLLTWKESSRRLASALTGAQPYRVWFSQSIFRMGASSKRLHSQIGHRLGHEIVGNGPGCIVYGPFVALTAGSYEVRIGGSLGLANPSEAVAEVTVEMGARTLARMSGRDWQAEGGWLLTMPFELAESCIDLELRIRVPEGSTISASMVEICAARPCNALRSG